MMPIAALFLVAYVATVSVVLGVLALTMIAHLSTATWFESFHVHARRVLRTLPALAAIGILLLFLVPVLFPWSAPTSTIATSDVAHYLNTPFFVARFVGYWVAWIALARALGATDRLAAAGQTERAATRYRRISSAGLIVLGFTMTFAAFDWMMSLTPDWSSTIYGVTWFAGGMVSALALLGLMASFDANRAAVPSRALDSLSKLLLTFVLFWLYTTFSQYIVIWSGGLPREVTWYLARTSGAWGNVALLLLLGGGLLPFLVLLLPEARRSATTIGVLGGVLLAVHFLDMLWVVAPGLPAFR